MCSVCSSCRSVLEVLCSLIPYGQEIERFGLPRSGLFVLVGLLVPWKINPCNKFCLDRFAPFSPAVAGTGPAETKVEGGQGTVSPLNQYDRSFKHRAVAEM